LELQALLRPVWIAQSVFCRGIWLALITSSDLIFSIY
jgi:hypothetical protein